MKIIAACQADLKTTPLGTRSRLADELDGHSVLTRTLSQVAAVRGIERVYVVVPSDQVDACKRLVHDSSIEFWGHQVAPAPWARLVQAARKWSLDGWRGGMGGTTSFDEYVDCRLLNGLLEQVGADAVLAFPPAAPMFDPSLAEGMIDLLQKADDEIRLTFAQTPPGVTGLVVQADLIKELVEKNAPIGWAFGYLPDSPQKDLIFQSCCYSVPAELRYAPGRLVADTDRSFTTIKEMKHSCEAADAATVGRWLLRRDREYVGRLPREVEIELTTDDPYPDALLRPRGRRVERRGPIDPALVQRVASEIAVFDDALMVLGGFGDPLCHPEFIGILEALGMGAKKDSSTSSDGDRGDSPRGGDVLLPYGLAVCTTAAGLSDEHIEALIRCGVDVLHVWLDAWSPDLYGRLQSPDDPASASLENVRRRLERVTEICRQHESPTPILLPAMVKARDNVHELDEFHDGWIRRVGAVHIAGSSHFAQQVENRAVISMAPPQRVPCRRIGWRCLVLADGRVAACDQDIKGRHVVGSLHEQSLEAIWNGSEFQSLRESHRAGRFDHNPLCAACDEWHRP